jgi:hypothetical protein
MILLSAMRHCWPLSIYIGDQIKEGLPKRRRLASRREIRVGFGPEKDEPKVFLFDNWLRPDSRQNAAIFAQKVPPDLLPSSLHGFATSVRHPRFK